MNFKELLLPFSLVLVVSLAFHFFFSRRSTEKNTPEEAASGQMYEVKHDPELVTPLNWTITSAEPEDQKGQTTAVHTAYGELMFSSAGAVLDHFLFKHGGQLLVIVDTKPLNQKMFLVALPDKTPYLYMFKGQQEDEKNIRVTYEYTLADAILTKTFVVNKQVPQIDLIVQVRVTAPKLESFKKLRILYSAPAVVAMNAPDIMAFVNDVHNPQLLKIYHKLDEVVYKTWRKPTLFGAADKFFVHALVKDHNNLVYRGAFNALNDDKDLIVQLETNDITQSGTWTLSFYIGPKQLALMNAVDNRLEQVLDYGFWSPISKLILMILNFLYTYFKSYGLAIIIFTLLLQLLLLPLSLKGQKSLEKQAELQRKIQYLKQKYRTDPERFKQEQAELVRTHGVGGMMGGCLILLVQTPIFLALNRLLSSCFELHQERFLWIPDLASYDPWYILPVLSCVTILVRAHTRGKPFTQQLSMYAFALIIGAVTTKLSAGLVLFILMGAVVNLGQMYLMRIKK